MSKCKFNHLCKYCGKKINSLQHNQLVCDTCRDLSPKMSYRHEAKLGDGRMIYVWVKGGMITRLVFEGKDAEEIIRTRKEMIE